MFRLDHAAEQAVRQRLGLPEADAFLARLEHLSFDIVEPLSQVYGSTVNLTSFVTGTTRRRWKAVADLARSGAGDQA